MKLEERNIEETISLLGKPEASFLLTRRCNNNCSHCCINLPANAEVKELSTKHWYKIIDQLVENNFLFLTFTGGEPTLYPGFKEVYMYAKRKGMFLRVMTNATNFDEETRAMLEKYPPYKIIVTIYGVDERTYTTVTGNKKGWGEFSKNMIFLAKLEKAKGTILELCSIFTKDTLKFQKAINELSLKYTNKVPAYTKALFPRLDKNPARNNLIAAKKISREELKRVAFEFEEPETACFDTERKNTYSGLFACQLEKRQSINFFEDGTMSYCNLIIDEKYTLKPKEEELENFNYKTMEQKLEEKFSSLLNRKINEKCGTCLLRRHCLTCPAKNLIEGIAVDGYVKETCLQEL